MDNWYESESWYAPLARQATPAETPAPQKKKKKIWPWVLLITLLSLTLIVGLSLLFHQEAQDPAPSLVLPGEGNLLPEQKPRSYREYFDALYPVEKTEAVQVKLPRADEISYEMELESAGETKLTLQELYEQCSPSVVGISGYITGKIGYNWGSGVILSEDGLIITNTHVIDGCDRVEVTLADDSSYVAKLVGADSISDIAVLKIEAEGLPAARFGDSSSLAVGEDVAAIGNPLSEQFRMTLTNGIISAIARDINYKSRTMTLLQTNVAINEGNSGGPLFNMSGQVIGITNMKMMSGASSIEGIGFAIPTSTIVGVVNGLISEGKVAGRVSIGITIGPIPEEAMELYDLPEGLYIADVSSGSDAEAKGLKIGDILTAVNGQSVKTTQEVADIKDQFGVGDELRFTIWRDGELFDVDVALVDTNDIYG